MHGCRKQNIDFCDDCFQSGGPDYEPPLFIRHPGLFKAISILIVIAVISLLVFIYIPVINFQLDLKNNDTASGHIEKR